MTRRKSRDKPAAGRLRMLDGRTGSAIGTPRLAPARRVTIAAAAVRAPKKMSAKLPPKSAGAAKAASVAAVAAATDPAELQHQLAGAHERIQELEQRLAAVTDRIAWIADRLHSLLDESD